MMLLNKALRPSRWAQFTSKHIRYYSAPSSSSIPLAKQKYVPTSGTYPKGFRVGATHVGVKASNKSRPDVAFIASDYDCSAAAVFTTNKFPAAPVLISKNILEQRNGEGIRGIVANSGCANASPEEVFLEDASAMATKADECFKGDKKELDDGKGSRTLVMSTGVIGVRLPIQKILTGIPVAYASLASTHSSWLTTARSICTTDTFPKLMSTSFTLPSSPDTTYNLAGMAKGAGMICPNMATLLGVMCTDAPIPSSTLSPLLKYAANRSFNSICVDNDMSTNDTVTLLANGAAGGEPITTTSPDYETFQSIVTNFAQKLAQLVVRDGEGATKFVTINVRNSLSYESAKSIAATIAKSDLVKTALYGKDANWGRIICAIGYAPDVPDSHVIPTKTSVSFVPKDGSEELKLFVRGVPQIVDEDRAAKILEHEDVDIVVDLGGGEDGSGKEEATFWTCDLSHEYVTINGDYRT
ncbi:MAG: hypothetical protein M1834_006188 [Cirrosporium novae-zelandiae]|nr:MAG: hypothetical protein M1834_006188 [Cirrosporium novae-zelandiae]